MSWSQNKLFKLLEKGLSSKGTIYYQNSRQQPYQSLNNRSLEVLFCYFLENKCPPPSVKISPNIPRPNFYMPVTSTMS